MRRVSYSSFQCLSAPNSVTLNVKPLSGKMSSNQEGLLLSTLVFHLVKHAYLLDLFNLIADFTLITKPSYQNKKLVPGDKYRLG